MLKLSVVEVSRENVTVGMDAKIAALERSSQDNERRISQAETDKMRHMDEVNNMNKKIIALENRNRNLESYNAEREAMIKALQKRYEEMENKGQSSSSLNPSKMETPTCSQPVIQESSKHQHSMSISNISSTSVFSATPHRDEELGNHRLNSDLIQCRPSILASDNHRFYSKEPEAKILQNHHSRSGSYCCYVSSPDQDELNIRKSGDKTVENPQPSQNPLLSSSYLIQDKKGIVETDSILSNDKKQVCFQLTENEQNKPKLQDCVYPSSNHFINVQSGAQTNPLITLTSVSNALDVPSTRGDPPPYFSQHQVLNFSSDSHSQHQQSPVKNIPSVCPPSQVRVQSVHQSQNQQQSQQIHCQPPQQVNQQSVTSNGNQSSLQSPPIPRVVAACQRPHPPNAFCRTCLTVRRSHRQNAAAFVRRAHSSGYQHNRRSAPSPASSADSLDDAPSILERLKKEWEMGFLGPPANKKETCGTTKKSDGSKTLPHPLGTSQPTPSNEIKEKEKTSNQEQQNQNYVTSEKENESQGKKDVSHLDRALNRLSMKRSSNPFGQKNINTDNCKFSSDTGSHQQPNPNVKTSNSNNNPALAYNSGSILTISSIDHNSCFSENSHKNVLEKSNIKYPDQINSSISSQFVKVSVPVSTHQPKEEKGDTKEPFVLDSSDRNNPNKN
ncbi:hypothetical protein Anas_09817 [Armadillidium nasatum]|uniref:Uncharacterized protein n=1 Tax=Armadillidium nasatum TaxID=96803 RepID=A0A5N5T660_9CRUS|nr:hypothetical protein Anas_09817 [Armadillidium nasatum]